MHQVSYLVFIWLGKIVSIVTRIAGKGEGTALPGLIAQKYGPSGLLPFLLDQIPQKVVITGTNGKTTTQTFLASIFKEAGLEILRNESGSNMQRGLLSNLIKNANLNGVIKEDVMILEVEEATLPKLIGLIKPQIVIVTNLFRDQLDAYGELDRTQKFIRQAVEQSPQSTLIVNGDDPLVLPITEGLPNKQIFYGIEAKYRQDFAYEKQNSTLSEQVTANQTKAEFHSAQAIQIDNNLNTVFELDRENFRVQIPGIYHVYNALAAILTAKTMDISLDKLQEGINNAKPAFGRGEVIQKDKLSYSILLVKNPAGLNLTLDLLTHITNPNLVLILNDKIADGRDVSWIWDANYELLNSIKPSNIVVSGERAADLLVRMKYALGRFESLAEDCYLYKGIDFETKIYFVEQIEQIHKFTTQTFPIPTQFYVLPTYTAMLAFRKNLLGKAIYG